MVNSEQIEQAIRASLEPVHVEINDLSGGCGQNFDVLIVSQLFKGKTTLARHRLVNSKLKDILKDIHAFTQKSLTPEEWEARSAAKNGTA
ncbi:BolA domain-containing protein [Schizosaccharomyces japonicus yFS275]|uniref:BolA domain-containing protein n=1 Tax=Schizosaccharomyces japonicus (strain yFS275 / FY16936) TaxID=402676 RepID=B6K2K6_SCHJY|nr:BolA domain-containing protein [Schizosaccharomyces japonicus yFS275]EEB07387.2 BolA domain-containing protein [Schizosaccharomyces japonicus yFS275]